MCRQIFAANNSSARGDKFATERSGRRRAPRPQIHPRQIMAEATKKQPRSPNALVIRTFSVSLRAPVEIVQAMVPMAIATGMRPEHGLE